MVNGLAFYSDDTSLNPMEVYFVEMLLLEKRANVNKKMPRFGPLPIIFIKIVKQCPVWIVDNVMVCTIVTRWTDYVYSIRLFSKTIICPMASNFAKWVEFWPKIIRNPQK